MLYTYYLISDLETSLTIKAPSLEDAIEKLLSVTNEDWIIEFKGRNHIIRLKKVTNNGE